MAGSSIDHSKLPPGYLEENEQAALYGVCVLFVVLDTIAVALRFVAKRVGRVPLNWGDVFIVLGYVLCIAVIGCSIADTQYGGIGLHEAKVVMIDPDMLVTWAKYVLIIPLIYLATVVPPKLALLILYLSIFTQKPYRAACHVCATIVVVNWLGATIAGFASCIPFGSLWTHAPGGHCFDINAWFRWSSLANILTDVVMLILPIPVVLNLHASTRLKLGILFTFLLGSLGLIASIIRFVGFFVTDAKTDPTWSAKDLIVWTVIETGIYLIAACLPTYRPLAKLIWHKTNFSAKKPRAGPLQPEANRSPMRPGHELKTSNEFPHLTNSTDDEDSIGLAPPDSPCKGEVAVGKDDINPAPGQILVKHKITVH